jgi:hypothetical protein
MRWDRHAPVRQQRVMDSARETFKGEMRSDNQEGDGMRSRRNRMTDAVGQSEGNGERSAGRRLKERDVESGGQRNVLERLEEGQTW